MTPSCGFDSLPQLSLIDARKVTSKIVLISRPVDYITGIQDQI